MNHWVLYITPNSRDAERMTEMLSPLPLSLAHARDLRQARNMLPDRRFSVVLTEAVLPDGWWTDVLETAREVAPGTEVIVTDPLADASTWAEVLNLGGYDMLAQPFYEPEVQRILSNACSRMPQATLHAAL